MLDVGLKERLGGGVVEGLDVSIDVATDTLEVRDEAERESPELAPVDCFANRIEARVKRSMAIWLGQVAMGCQTHSSILRKVVAADTGSSSYGEVCCSSYCLRCRLPRRLPARTCRNLESASASSIHCSYPREEDGVIARAFIVAMEGEVKVVEEANNYRAPV